MRTVLLVTQHADVAGLVPAFESAGLSARSVVPREFSLEAAPDGGAIVLDFRDVADAGFRQLQSHLDERSVALVALIDAGQMARIAVDLPVDDFVLDTAAKEEVVRRVERALWRRHGIDSENLVTCGALSIDLANYRVTVDGEPQVLTFKEFELLRFLAMNTGQVFTREQLLNRVWGYDYFGGARTVDVHIRRIRAKIEIHGHTFIETVRNVGYRMLAPSS